MVLVGAGVATLVALPRAPSAPITAASTAAAPSIAATTSAPPALAATALLAVNVPITPRDADVTVAGAPRALSTDGALALEGQPGDSFDVVVSRGKARVEEHVVILKDGTATPSAIELKIPAGTAGVAPKTAATGAAAAPPATTATPAATPTTATPKPKDTW